MTSSLKSQIMAMRQNLQHWCISGISHCISEATNLDPGSFYVLNQSEFDGNLSNSGERLTLTDPLDRVVDVVEYADSDPWPLRRMAEERRCIE